MRSLVHTLLFLDPGHFHAALTLRVPHPRIDDEIFVYAPPANGAGAELRDFLALVDRFNRRSAEPTRWRPTVLTSGDPLASLVTERRGDVVVLAGRNGGKARTIRRLHDAGFHVLADKPWLVEVGDLEDVRQSLGAPPLAWEIMTGRHDWAARLMKRLVDLPDVFGRFSGDGPALELESVHHLEKLVDGAPLRRPTWYFDVRVQGSGAVDIPTHLVDQTQWLTEGAGRVTDEAPKLSSARAWPTRVPAEAFERITKELAFPAELRPFVVDNALEFLCNAELSYQVSGVRARVAASWNVAAASRGGDHYRAAAHGSGADIVLEQGPETRNRRRVTIMPRGQADRVARAVRDAVASWQAELPGVGVEPSIGGAMALVLPPALATGHEAHFALVLDSFVRAIDGVSGWPAALAARTLAKYTLLAEAAAAVAP
jgi:predicted dehydrogenase